MSRNIKITSMTLRRVLLLTVALIAAGCGSEDANLTEFQRMRSGDLDVLVLSERGSLQHGTDTFVIEFRSVSTGALTDVGDVRASATMPMPGMPMFGSIDVQRTNVPGRYRASGEFSMAGAWRLSIEWSGPEGRNSVSFTGAVQ